jgi:hypothetical protein
LNKSFHFKESEDPSFLLEDEEGIQNNDDNDNPKPTPREIIVDEDHFNEFLELRE